VTHVEAINTGAALLAHERLKEAARKLLDAQLAVERLVRACRELDRAREALDYEEAPSTWTARRIAHGSAARMAYRRAAADYRQALAAFEAVR
jgi:hypothetical protein